MNNNDDSSWWGLLVVPLMAAGCLVQLFIYGLIIVVAVWVFFAVVGLFGG